MVGELERVHLNCFPGYGSIRVDAMMVGFARGFFHLNQILLFGAQSYTESVTGEAEIVLLLPARVFASQVCFSGFKC